MQKKWEVKAKLKPKNKSLNVDKIIKTLLKNRGLKTKKQINNFLNPPDPYNINSQTIGINKKQLKKAIKRIKKAIKSKELIIIYGDYDADGICATAILWETLHNLGAKVMPFIPHREKHGYGLNKKGIDELLKTYYLQNLKLLITVDNGIVANKPIDYANKKNLDVIISDHHQPPKKMPKADSIIWSDQVSGAGVAWFLAKDIHNSFYKSLKKYKASNSLELACIGTITDQMPVLDINRSLIRHGLNELQKSKRAGIKALCSESGIDQSQIGNYEIGYIIGPRLNAMGRLENALDSLRLLCTNNKKRAADLAGKLGLTNRQRQQLTETVFEHAKNKFKTKATKDNILFYSHPSYNQGVIGLVAGRIVEEYYKPTIIISQQDKFSKGSARSISGFNMIKNLRKLKNIFEDLGGHPMAAGFTIKTKNIKKLEKDIKKLAKKIKTRLLQPKIKADLEINLDDISLRLIKSLEKFSPYGIGNPKPTFISQEAQVINKRTVGRNNQHLKLQLIPGFEAIAFNQGNLSKKIKNKDYINIIFNIEKNVWNNKERIQLKIKDMKTIKDQP